MSAKTQQNNYDDGAYPIASKKKQTMASQAYLPPLISFEVKQIFEDDFDQNNRKGKKSRRTNKHDNPSTVASVEFNNASYMD